MRVTNSNLFLLPGNPHMLHLGTIEHSFQEFIVMTCIKGPHKGKTYIEEVVLNTVDWTSDVFANLRFIQDDNLVNDLFKFAEEHKLSDMKRVTDTLIDSGKESWIL